MAERRPLVLIGGSIQQLPSGDTLPGAGGSGLQNNLAATAAPAVTDDSGSGYSVGSRWIDVTNDNTYTCVDSTVGAAVWVQENGTGSTGTGGTTEQNPTARYFRLANMESVDGGGWNVGWNELYLRDATDTRLVASAVSASTSHGSYPAINGYDNNTATLWSATTNSGVWYQVDLGTPTEVVKVEISRRTGSGSSATPTGFLLQISDDGTTWTDWETYTLVDPKVDVLHSFTITKTVETTGGTGASLPDDSAASDGDYLATDGAGNFDWRTPFTGAPADGTLYGQQDGSWVEIPSALGDILPVARYFRLANMDSIGGGAANVGVDDFALLDKADNVIPAVAVAASTQHGSYPATNAYDQNNATLWSALEVTNVWYSIDLGSIYEVAKLQINTRSVHTYSPISVTIQTSEDGITWTDRGVITTGITSAGVYDYSLAGFGFFVVGVFEAPVDTAPYVRKDGAWADLTTLGSDIATALDTELTDSWRIPPPVSAVSSRYWRLFNLGGGRRAAREIKFIDPNGNVLAGTYTASSVRSGSSLAGAQDDNLTTYWEAGTSETNAWFAVDFGSPKTVSSVLWTAFGTLGPLTGFQVQVSDDGTTWTTVETISHSFTYVDNTDYTFDFVTTIGTYNAISVMYALDNHFGEISWRKPQLTETGGRFTGSWTAAEDLISVPTMGLKLKTGTVGVIRVDVAPGADTVIQIHDENGTILATGTILSAGTSALLTAASDGTALESVVLHGLDSSGSISEITFVLRGELV